MSCLPKIIPGHYQEIESVFETTSTMFTCVRAYTDGEKLYFYNAMNDLCEIIDFNHNTEFPNLQKRLKGIENKFNRDKNIQILLGE